MERRTYNPQQEVTKLWFAHESEIGYIEKYYSHYLNEPRLKVKLDLNAPTSYFDPTSFKINISANNLMEFLNTNPQIAYASFYSLVLHEIGHAIYTNPNMSSYWSDMLNIIEDNRLEFQISLWNKVVKFNIIKYLLADSKINHQAKLLVENKDVLGVALGLLRTVDNSPMISQFKTPEQQAILDKIFKLNYDYMFRDITSKQMIDYSTYDIKEFVKPSREIERLIIELLELREQQKQKPNQPTQPTNQQPNDDDESDGSSNDKDEENSNPTLPKQAKTSNSNQNSNLEKAKQDSSKMKHEFNETLENAKLKSEEILHRYDKEPIGRLYNQHEREQPYEPYKIEAFDAVRRSGVKGNGLVNRNSGNAKQLVLKRYMRKDLVRGEKLFSKNMSQTIRGGETSSILFYLDISSSMSQNNRIGFLLNYMRSFYDKMSSYINIRMFAFGENTYELTRHELDNNFIYNNLEGSTNPTLLPYKPNEHVVLITDGAFDFGRAPQEYCDNAHFVLIEPNDYLLERYKEWGIRNLVSVDTRNLNEGVNQATSFIRKILQKG